jgi:hypothetical protein
MWHYPGVTGSGVFQSEGPGGLRFQALLKLRLAAEGGDLVAVLSGDALAVANGIQMLDVQGLAVLEEFQGEEELFAGVLDLAVNRPREELAMTPEMAVTAGQQSELLGEVVQERFGHDGEPRLLPGREDRRPPNRHVHW